MDFRKELSKWGYNIGNSIDVEILIKEILPDIFKKMDSEEEVINFVNSILSEIEIRKNNIIENKEKMPVHLREGGCMAFESSQDCIKEKFEQFKNK